MRNTTDWEDLYKRFLKNTCSTEEVRELMDHFEKNGHDSPLAGLVEQALMDDDDYPAVNEAEIDLILNRSDLRIASGLKARKQRRLYQQVATVAAAAVFIIWNAYLFFNIHFHKPGDQQLAAIPREHKKAMLTLATGDTLSLSPDQESLVVDPCGIRYNTYDVLVQRDAQDLSGALYSIHVPAGGQYDVALPDGSTVRLNAGSTLRFPLNFVGRQRIVELDGEGSFAVTSGTSLFSRDKPFYVRSAGQEVRVLGTRFTVSAYREDGVVKTTLIDGIVQVFSGKGDSLLLSPGEQATYTQQGTLSKQKVNLENELAWRQGEIELSGKPFAQLMRELARWYGLDVVYQGKVPDIQLAGQIRQDEPLTTVQVTLKDAGLSYHMEGDHRMVIHQQQKQTP